MINERWTRRSHGIITILSCRLSAGTEKNFEKGHEHNINLYNIFVDYTHAFESVYRNKLIECLKKFDVPDKLIRLIALTLKHTRARVKINKDYTEDIIVKCRVKQGDPLSATLFSSVIDTILKQMELRGNITTHLKQCLPTQMTSC